MTISEISQLLLIRFLPNFTGRIIGACLKDAKCYGDICPGNICHGGICPYKQSLSKLNTLDLVLLMSAECMFAFAFPPSTPTCVKENKN